MRLWLGIQARNGANTLLAIKPPLFQRGGFLFDLKTYELGGYQTLSLAGKFRIGVHAQF